MKYSVMILFLLLVFAFSGCDDSKNPVSYDPDGYEITDSTTFHESLLMSLWYTHDLYPDSNIAFRFYENLLELREKYGDSIPDVNLKFYPLYSPNLMSIGFDTIGLSKIRNNTFYELDSLNEIYGVEKIDTSNFSPYSKSALVSFKYPINVKLIVGDYKRIEGISYADYLIPIGDWSNLYPWIYRDKITFLTRRAMGDCPSGCPGGEFNYFRESDSGMEYIGFYSTVGPDEGIAPDWWIEGRIAYYIYSGYTIWD